MKAHFGRKITDLDSLAAATRRAKEENRSGSAYVITKEVELSDSEFQRFADDLLEDQPWIGKTDGGMTPAGGIPVHPGAEYRQQRADSGQQRRLRLPKVYSHRRIRADKRGRAKRPAPLLYT